MTPIYHVIYSSMATQRLSQNQLVDLLALCRRKNEPLGLTGMLLYRDGMYLQFLEGPRENVEELITRLRKDSRHSQIHILREGILRDRLFPDWSMAFKNLGGLKSSNVAGYSERLQGNSVRGGAKDPTELLVSMFYELVGSL